MDKLELKAIDGGASYAALEKKAELCEKLARGELSDEEDKEKYSADFFGKSLMRGESQQTRSHDTSVTESTDIEDGETGASMLLNTRPAGLSRTGGTVDSSEQKRFVREVHEEATQAREKTSEVKLRRQEQAAARWEKLKQAYLRKQLEKLKAASKTEQS